MVMWSVCCLEALFDTMSGLYGVSVCSLSLFDAMSWLYGFSVDYGLCLIQCLGYMEYLLLRGFV